MAVSRKKQYEIIKNTTRDLPIMDLDGKRMKFARNGSAFTTDPGVARAVEQKYGKKGSREAVVIEVDNRDPARERGHKYTFSMPEMPWKVKGKKRKAKAQ